MKAGEEDIPICRARITCFVWLNLGFTPDTCQLHRSAPRCLACLMEMPRLLLLPLWVHGGGALGCFTLMFWLWRRSLWEWFQDMAAVAQIITGSFLQSEFIMQWWIKSPCILFVALCYCVIHVSHVSRPKQQFTVVNRHPCHCAGISPSVPLWAPAEADDLIEVTNVSPGFFSLHLLSLFMELDSSPLSCFSR